MQRRDLLLTAAAATIAANARPTTAAAPAKPLPKIRTRDGVELFHREWGSGGPVLFVHAWALSSAMWTYQIADLGQRGCRCIAFDRRGHGRSDVPSGGYDLDTLADDIAAVILPMEDIAGVKVGVAASDG